MAKVLSKGQRRSDRLQLSISEIARRTKLSKSMVSLVFAGKRTPSLKTLKAIADLMGWGVEETLRRLQERPQSEAA